MVACRIVVPEIRVKAQLLYILTSERVLRMPHAGQNNLFLFLTLKQLFPSKNIVGPPWKEGEIRLGVDKPTLNLLYII